MKKLFTFKWLLLSIVLSIAGVNSAWAGYIYLDPSSFTDWYNENAWFSLWNADVKSRFNDRTDLGNGLWRFNVGSYPTGDYYFQRMKNNTADGVHNEVEGSVTSSSNVMKITGWSTGSMQTSFVIHYYHNTNEIYFDNSVSNFTGNIYFVIGYDCLPTGGEGVHSVAYAMESVVGTKLYHVQTTAEWKDATYYAIIASSTTISSDDNNWGSSSLSTKGDNGYTAAYKSTVYDIEGGKYLITTATTGNNQDITIAYQGANVSDISKYAASQAAKKRDTGTEYSDVDGSWPATLKLFGSYMSDVADTARSTITSTTSEDGDANKTYNVIRTGTVTQSYTSLSSSYYFEGWGTGSTPSKTTATYEYYILENTTVYAFFSKLYALTFEPKGTYGGSTVTAEVTNYTDIDSGDDVPTGHSITITASPATGYRLVSPQAWYSDASCSSSLSNGTSTTYTISSLNAARGVYAQFEAIPYSITYKDQGGGDYSGKNIGSLPDTHTYNIATDLVDGEKAGCEFDGWYTDEDCTESAGSELGATDYTDNITLYAKWTSPNFVIYRTGDSEDDPRSTPEDVESYVGGTISEVIEFRMKVGAKDTWYTLCLPFTVSAVQVWDEDDNDGDGGYTNLVPFYRTGEGYFNGHYIIRTPSPATNLSISDFGNWVDPSSSSFLPSKNTPYIIQWHDSYFVDKYVSFFGASGQTIPTFSAGSAPTTDNVVNVYGNNSMTSGSVAGAYLLDPYYGSSGAWLRGATADASQTVYPFECYIRANDGTTRKYRVMRRGMAVEEGTTGLEDVANPNIKSYITAYTITGFPVAQFENCSFDEAGKRLRADHNEGIFILRSENESVKLIMGE